MAEASDKQKSKIMQDNSKNAKLNNRVEKMENKEQKNMKTFARGAIILLIKPVFLA